MFHWCSDSESNTEKEQSSYLTVCYYSGTHQCQPGNNTPCNLATMYYVVAGLQGGFSALQPKVCMHRLCKPNITQTRRHGWMRECPSPGEKTLVKKLGRWHMRPRGCARVRQHFGATLASTLMGA
jgi:hypothetical protein